MDEELTVGTLGIDVEANVGEFERESGERLKAAAARVGRDAGRSMGDGITAGAAGAADAVTRPVADSAARSGAEAGRRLGESLTTEAARASQGLADVGTNIGENAVDSAREAGERAGRAMGEGMGAEAADAVQRQAGPLADAAESAGRDAGATLGGAMAAGAADATSGLSELGARAADGADEAGARAGRALGDALAAEAAAGANEAAGAIGRNAEPVREAARAVGQEAGQAMGDALSEAQIAASETRGQAAFQRLRERQRAAMQGFSTDAKRSGKEAGDEMSRAFVTAAQERMRADIGRVRLDFEKGLLDRAQMKQGVRDAVRDMNREIAAEIERRQGDSTITPEAFEHLSGALKDAGKEGADGFMGHLRRIQAFLQRDGLSIRGIFRAGSQEIRSMGGDVSALTASSGRLVGVMGSLLGILLTIAGIRALFRFAEEARELARETDNASDRLQALQDSVSGRAQAWTDFKIAVGTALLEMQGVQRVSDIVGAILGELKRILDENSEAWRLVGTAVSGVVEFLARFGAVIGAAVLGPTGLLIRSLALLTRAYAEVFEAGARFRGFLTGKGIADAHAEEIRRMRENAEALDELGRDLDAAAAKAGRVGVLGFGALPTVTAPGATTQREEEERQRREEEAAREAKRRAEELERQRKQLIAERTRLEEQAAQRLIQLTQDATAIALQELARLEAAYVKAGGTLESAFGANIQRIRELVLAGADIEGFQEEFRQLTDAEPSPAALNGLQELAARVEAYRAQVADSIPLTEQLDALLKRIGEQSSKIEIDALTSDLRQALERRQAELREALAANLIDTDTFEGQGAKAADAFATEFNARLLERIRSLRAQGLQAEADAISKLLIPPREDTDDEGRKRQERIRELREQARTLEENARAAIQVARAFGLIGEQAAESLQNVAQLAGAITRIAGSLEGGFDFKTFDFSAVGTAIGAVAGLMEGLFGESPQERERRRIIESNTQALNKLALELSGFRATAQNITGARRALEPFEDSRNFLLVSRQRPDAARTLVERSLADFGLTLEELSALAEKYGIEIFDENGNIVAEALSGLTKQLRQAEQALVGFRKTVDDQRQLAERRADIFDEPDTAQARLQREVDLLARFTPDLLGNLDASTAEGRAQIEAGIRELFEQFAAGTLDLGDLTREEFLELIGNIEGALDELDEGAFGAGLEGRLNALDFVLSNLGDEAGDARARLEAFADAVAEFEPEFAAELRQRAEQDPVAAREWLQELIRAFADQGTDSALIRSVFGDDRTAQEIMRILQDANGFLAELTEGAGAAAGQTRNFVRDFTITEVTAQRLAGYMLTQTLLQTDMRDYLRVIAAATGAPLPAGLLAQSAVPAQLPPIPAESSTSVVTIDVGGIAIEVQLTAKDVTPANAEVVGTELGRAAGRAIDETLGKRFLDGQRVQGRSTRRLTKGT